VIELLLQAERALSVGLLDRAETLYQQVANADPRNSIAVVGLARVTLDRGDDVGALALARRALEIDPENDAAIRLVARLEEVIDYRTEAAASLDLDAATVEGVAEPGPEPEREPAPEPEPVPEPEPEPAAPPPPPPLRRSLLDRLFRRR
jgi:thioredoxin-like negative regulator of GroEL